jgi:hypothetical protein
VVELERDAAEAVALRAELTAARGQLGPERAARQAELDALRRDRDSLRQRLDAWSREPEPPVAHGIELGGAPREAAGRPRAAEPGRSDAAVADLQKLLAEAGRQLREARERAARLEDELRKHQQWVTVRVMPLNKSADDGGPPRG